jgi:hypothetical protein
VASTCLGDEHDVGAIIRAVPLFFADLILASEELRLIVQTKSAAGGKV